MAIRPRAFPTLDPTLDIVFRRFFADPDASDLLIHFLTVVLVPEKPIARVDVISPMHGGATADEKDVVLDLLVVLDNGDHVDVEMQCRRADAIENRVTFYWATTLGSSLARGEPYDALPRAVFVGIFGFVWDDDEPLHVVIRPVSEATGKRFTDRFEAHFLQLPKLDEHAPLDGTGGGRQASLIEWLRFFWARTDDERAELAWESPIMQRAVERLEKLSTDADLQLAAQKRADDIRLVAMAQRKAVAEAEARGEARGEARVLVRLLELKFGSISDSHRARVAAATTIELEAWAERVLVATSLDEIFVAR